MEDLIDVETDLLESLEKLKKVDDATWEKIGSFLRSKAGKYLMQYLQDHKEACENAYRRRIEPGSKYDFICSFLETINKQL